MSRRNKKLEENEEFWIEYGVDIKNRRVMLDEDVDHSAIGVIIRAVQLMEDTESDLPIKVYINTYGGSCYDGLALYDVLTLCKAPIHTYGIGKVMSMGTWLMLAGDEKFCYPSTTFMWHSLSDDISAGKLFDLKVNTAEAERLYGVLLDIYDKKSNKSLDFWKKWIKYEDRYGDAEKAKELGFVDFIVDKT